MSRERGRGAVLKRSGVRDWEMGRFTFVSPASLCSVGQWGQRSEDEGRGEGKGRNLEPLSCLPVHMLEVIRPPSRPPPRPAREHPLTFSQGKAPFHPKQIGQRIRSLHISRSRPDIPVTLGMLQYDSRCQVYKGNVGNMLIAHRLFFIMESSGQAKPTKLFSFHLKSG